MICDLRHGPWQTALAHVEACDVLCTDAPYGPRTHKGYRTGASAAPALDAQLGVEEYQPLTRADCHELALSWAWRTKKWALIFGDHETWAWHAEAWEAQGWYVFAPIPWIRRNATPRFSGDGPQRSAEWIMRAVSTLQAEDGADELMVARRRVTTKCGSLPGYYFVTRVEGQNGARSQMSGQKPLDGMKQLLEDYTELGDVVVDTYAGYGTTLVAGRSLGLGVIGAEIDEGRYVRARDRLIVGTNVEVAARRGQGVLL